MPYADGTYTTPAWTNYRPPFVLADELTAMCDTAAQGQTRTAEFKLSADELKLGTDKNLQSRKAEKTFLINSYTEERKMSTYSPNLQKFEQVSGFSTDVSDVLVASYNTLNDLFVWYPEKGSAIYYNTKVGGNSSASQLFPSHGTITNASLSINNLGIGLASGASAYLGGGYVMAYTLNGGKTWTELTNYQEWFGEVKSVTVNDDGTGFIFADGCYYFDSYAFIRNDTSVLQSVNPFAPTQQGGASGWDINNCTKPSFNRKGSGLIFDNVLKKYAFTFDSGKTWTVSNYSDISRDSVEKAFILDSNGVAIFFRGSNNSLYLLPTKLSASGLTSSGYLADDYSNREFFPNGNYLLSTRYLPALNALNIWCFKDFVLGSSQRIQFNLFQGLSHTTIALNDDNEFVTFQAGSGSYVTTGYLVGLAYPTCDYGQIVTDQIAPY